jgi:hypothetical protein
VERAVVVIAGVNRIKAAAQFGFFLGFGLLRPLECFPTVNFVVVTPVLLKVCVHVLSLPT